MEYAFWLYFFAVKGFIAKNWWRIIIFSVLFILIFLDDRDWYNIGYYIGTIINDFT